MLAMMAGKERKYRAAFHAGTILRLQKQDDDIRPKLETIEKWCSVSGATLAEFFEQFESPRNPGSRHIAGHEDIYEYLGAILLEGNSEKIAGIRSNLKYLCPKSESPQEVSVTGSKPVKKRA